LLPYLFLASALGLLGEWAVSVVAPRPAAVLLYVHVAVVSPILISTFWSHVNEQYDPFTAKRAVARIAGGGTAGGLIGGVLTWRASSIMSLRSAILALAVLNVLCVVGVLISRASGPLPVKVVRSTEPDPGALAPLRLLARAPFLRSLALLVAGGAAISSLLDYVFTAQAMVAYGKGEPLLAFFSLFGLAVALVSLAVQLALGRVATEKMGLVVNVGLLPGIILLGGAAGLAVPGLLSASALRGAELVYRNTLFRAAYELLYTPISPVLKRTTKALVDVGFDRLGTMLGAAVLAA
jgi:AAA family ATP:ADP antiporter